MDLPRVKLGYPSLWWSYHLPVTPLCSQGPSTAPALQAPSTLLTWMAGTISLRTVNATATIPNRTAFQVGISLTVMWYTLCRGCRERIWLALCSVVYIDRAVFASIEDSDSDLDNHDSSSNTSADDHMTSTKRTHHRGVKEVSVPVRVSHGGVFSPPSTVIMCVHWVRACLVADSHMHFLPDLIVFYRSQGHLAL